MTNEFKEQFRKNEETIAKGVIVRHVYMDEKACSECGEENDRPNAGEEFKPELCCDCWFRWCTEEDVNTAIENTKMINSALDCFFPVKKER